MIQWRKIISFDFHHIPKLSIGFNSLNIAKRLTFSNRLFQVTDKYEEEIFSLKDQLREAQARGERLEVNSKQIEASECELKQQVRSLQTRLQEEIENAATKIDHLEVGFSF